MKTTVNLKTSLNLKAMGQFLRTVALDGLYFLTALALTLGGFWGLVQIDASLFTIIIFGILMIPSLLSTAYYLSRDLNKASHTFIA